MIKQKFIYLLSIITLTFLLSSCGGKPKVFAITITGNDLMQYDTKSFVVKAGSSVTILLKNIGTLPKAAMGHNIIILQKSVDLFTFGAAVANNGGTVENGFTPVNALGQTIAHSILIGAGEETTIAFTAPKEPGDYPYFCTFPGHFALMNGIMKVIP